MPSRSSAGIRQSAIECQPPLPLLKQEEAWLYHFDPVEDAYRTIPKWIARDTAQSKQSTVWGLDSLSLARTGLLDLKGRSGPVAFPVIIND